MHLLEFNVNFVTGTHNRCKKTNSGGYRIILCRMRRWTIDTAFKTGTKISTEKDIRQNIYDTWQTRSCNSGSICSWILNLFNI